MFLKILFWNVNRRLGTILKNISPFSERKPDLFFASEISVGYEAINNYAGYTKFADETIRERNHGGIACYVKNNIASHVFNVTFNLCYISLRLDFAPNYLFIGTYIQPESSSYFEPEMFSHLSTLLISANEKKLIPILGGDINCRYNDLNKLYPELNMHYDANIDDTSNMHGRTYGKDMCQIGEVFPLNHLKYGGKHFPGDFTYIKAQKKSQIDFVYTNKTGVKYIKDFHIHSENWHFSDHKPVEVELSTPVFVNVSHTLIRARELNYEFNPHAVKIIRHTKNYDFDMMSRLIKADKELLENNILTEIQNCSIDGAIKQLHGCLNIVHKKSMLKPNKTKRTAEISMEKANLDYNAYKNSLNEENEDVSEITFAEYQKSRNKITQAMYTSEHLRWKDLVDQKNSKDLWSSIDWKGSINKQNAQRASDEELATHFEELQINRSR